MPDALTITRRTAIGAIGAAGLGFVLWPTEQRNIPKGRVVLDYWEKWTGHEAAPLRETIKRFNESQDRIWVRGLTISAMETKAMVAIAGGDPPDVVGLWSFSIPQFSEARAILPFDELPHTRDIPKDLYAPGVWKLLTHRGRQWGAVNTCGTVALYYNKTMFKEAGLDPDRPPQTIAELDEYAERLTVRDRDGSLLRAGFLHKEPGWWPHLWPLLFDGSFYDPEADLATTDLPQNIVAYDWLQSYPKQFRPGELSRFGGGFGNYNSPQMAFLSEKVAMIVQGPWLVNNIRAFRPGLEFGAGLLPVQANLLDPDRPRGLLESDVLVIPRGCKHPEEAAEFVTFMQRPEHQERICSAHCKSSPLRVSSDAFVANHPNPYVRVHDKLAQSEAVSVNPRTRVWPQYAKELQVLVDRVWLDEGKPADLLPKVASTVQSALDKAAQRRRQRGQDPG